LPLPALAASGLGEVRGVWVELSSLGGSTSRLGLADGVASGGTRILTVAG
jgi:hypothetical protein